MEPFYVYGQHNKRKLAFQCADQAIARPKLSLKQKVSLIHGCSKRALNYNYVSLVRTCRVLNVMLLQLEEREKERVAFQTMQRPDFDGSGGNRVQGNLHETWLDKLKKGWKEEPLLPLVPLGMQP